MRTRILISVLFVVMAAMVFTLKTLTIGPLAFAGGRTVALADYHAADPTGVPQNLDNADQVKRGEYLALAADCLVCHTAPGGADYAGGLAIPLPFGTLYTTNITPDKDTGIGNYSDQEFLDALRRGKQRDGAHLYPAMPYTSYTYMTDADGLAIKAYLFSLPAVHATARDNTFAFPFNQRWLMVFWSTLFNANARFAPNRDRSPEWNRGAYIAEALAHCGDCQTPRNLGLALDNGKKFAGAVTAGWHAFNITSDQGSGIGGWSDDDPSSLSAFRRCGGESVDTALTTTFLLASTVGLMIGAAGICALKGTGRTHLACLMTFRAEKAVFAYLATGHALGRGTAAGPMGEAVDQSFSEMAPSDIRALVSYVRSFPPVASPDLPSTLASPAPASPEDGRTTRDMLGKEIFEESCVSCHNWTDVSAIIPYATVAGARAVNDRTATNVAQIMISGTNRHTPSGVVSMPAFGSTHSDREIAAVSNYVTARFGSARSDITDYDLAGLRSQTSR